MTSLDKNVKATSQRFNVRYESAGSKTEGHVELSKCVEGKLMMPP